MRTSVVTIFLNSGPFLRESVDSVLAQTDPDWELLLVDDGSTDGATEFARQIAREHADRVRYFEHEGHANLGMSASRNLGIRHARAGFVAFIDSDDVWLPEKLAEQVRLLDGQPDAAMVFGPALLWHEWNEERDRGRDREQSIGFAPDRLILPPDLLVHFLYYEDATPSPSGILVRKNAIDKIGGFENRFRTMYEDQAFYAKLLLEHAAYISSRCWYRYRQHPGACCSIAERNGTWQAARARFLDWLEEYLRARRAESAPLLQALRRAQWPLRHPKLDGLRIKGQTLLNWIKGRPRE